MVGAPAVRSKEEAKTDCSYCRAPCCQLLVELGDEEYHKYEWEWMESPKGPSRKLKQREEDGYCVYFVHGQGCSIYEEKPLVCDHYTCRDDLRISPDLRYGPIKPFPLS